MPCYAKNPVLLFTTGCHRTVCIHCRVEVRIASPAETGSAPCEEVPCNLPPAASSPFRTLPPLPRMT
jgi:hypothetical protein